MSPQRNLLSCYFLLFALTTVILFTKCSNAGTACSIDTCNNNVFTSINTQFNGNTFHNIINFHGHAFHRFKVNTLKCMYIATPPDLLFFLII